MRHTALSYHVRRDGSEEATATWAGNSVTIIRNHYKNKVSKADCTAFWAITPEQSQCDIIPMPKAAQA
jgi:hypothetical protein